MKTTALFWPWNEKCVQSIMWHGSRLPIFFFSFWHWMFNFNIRVHIFVFISYLFSGFTIFSTIKRRVSVLYSRIRVKRLDLFYCQISSGMVKRLKHFTLLRLCINWIWNRCVHWRPNICRCCGIFRRKELLPSTRSTGSTPHSSGFICIISHHFIICTCISPF